MNSHDDDRELREAFAHLRREEAAQVTAFHRVLETAGRVRARPASPMLATALAVVAVLVLGLVIGHQFFRPAPGADVAPLAGWVEPTAFLLRTPGQDLISTLPAFARDAPALPAPPVSPRS